MIFILHESLKNLNETLLYLLLNPNKHIITHAKKNIYSFQVDDTLKKKTYYYIKIV
jgi:hypothetical protein